MATEVKRVLCCIALAETSESVLLRALVEAEAHGAELHVLHVIPAFDSAMATPIAAFMGEDKFRKLSQEHKDEVQAAVTAAIDKLKTMVSEQHLEGAEAKIAQVHVMEGNPEMEILHLADVLNANLLVMGTHTKGFSAYTFVGSVSSKVLKSARVPVMMVPPVKH